MDTCRENRHSFSAWKNVDTHILPEGIYFTQTRYCGTCGWAEIRDVIDDDK